MSVFDDDLMDNLSEVVLNKFIREFDIKSKHKKPGWDCVGNKLEKGDLVLVISPSTMTKTRLIPAIVIKHTKVKTQVKSLYSYDEYHYDIETHKREFIGEKHTSFYPEQIIKIDKDTIIKGMIQ